MFIVPGSTVHSIADLYLVLLVAHVLVTPNSEIVLDSNGGSRGAETCTISIKKKWTVAQKIYIQCKIININLK